MNDLRSKLNELGSDLFKDLRDRRMLLPVALLLVAIVAVPFLIGGGEETPEAVPIADPAPAGAEELDAVVLAGGQGVRDFHGRVDGRPRNPFKQQYPGLKESSSDDGSDSSSSTAGTTSDAISTGTSTGTGLTTQPSTPPTTPTTPDEPQKPQEPKRVTKLIRMTVDVRISHSGKKRDIEGVEPLSFVPGDKSPITQYTGASRDAREASFVLSPAVASTEGDGNCMPGRNNCQFLVLEPGESQYFHYGPKAKRYRLKLLAINRVVVKEKEKGSEAGSSDGGGKGSGGASAQEIG